MTHSNKTAQLQIRLSRADKLAIQRAAKLLNLDMSSYVLDKLLPKRVNEFQILINNLTKSNEPGFVFAEINTLLSELNGTELESVLLGTLPVEMSNYLNNYLAAMVEYVCSKQQVKVPEWVKSVQPLTKPVFGSKLQSLQLYLLTHSPAPFRRRNIFIDTSVGGQV